MSASIRFLNKNFQQKQDYEFHFFYFILYHERVNDTIRFLRFTQILSLFLLQFKYRSFVKQFDAITSDSLSLSFWSLKNIQVSLRLNQIENNLGYSFICHRVCLNLAWFALLAEAKKDDDNYSTCQWFGCQGNQSFILANIVQDPRTMTILFILYHLTVLEWRQGRLNNCILQITHEKCPRKNQLVLGLTSNHWTGPHFFLFSLDSAHILHSSRARISYK